MRMNLFFIYSGFVLASYGGFLVPTISDAVVDSDPGVSDDEKLKKSLLCLIALGVAECFGGLLLGKIVDRFGSRPGLFFVLAVNIVTVGLTVYVHSVRHYDWRWFLVCFCWGILDSSHNTLINTILAFEFTSKTEPFSVYKFLQSLAAFVGFIIESELSSFNDTRWFFVSVGLLGVVASLLVLTFPFTEKAPAEGAKGGLAANDTVRTDPLKKREY